jgi:hypothetical protein
VPQTYVPTDSLAHGIFICNEGNFQWGNASLSFYNTTTGTVQEDAYKSVNQKGIGDVLQSITLANGLAYLVVNNSQKIEIIDPKTFETKGQISGFNSPRYIQFIGSNKAFVSDLYENAVWIINPETKSISGKIAINSWTEEMVYTGNSVFVCGRTTSYVYKINATNNVIEDSIPIGYGAQNMILDADQKLWVLTVGKGSIPAQLHRINLNNNIEKTFNFPSGIIPNKLLVNSNKTKIYFLLKDLFIMDIHASALPLNPLVQANGRTFYGLGYNPIKNEILLSDAKDYIQKSDIYRIDSLGQEIASFKAGINSTYFNWK